MEFGAQSSSQKHFRVFNKGQDRHLSQVFPFMKKNIRHMFLVDTFTLNNSYPQSLQRAVVRVNVRRHRDYRTGCLKAVR